jgi:hypothetical protein
MSDLITLLIWSIPVFSAANIVVVSKIFYNFRLWATYSKLEKIENEDGSVRYEGTPRKFLTLSNLVHCHMCLGFWVGVFFGIFVFSPTQSILLGDYELVNYFSDGLMGSIFCWVYYLAIKNHQGGS